MTTVRPIRDLDVPLEQLEADIKRLALRRAYAHQPEPMEAEFAALACACPDACSCDDNYAGWAEHIAALQAANQTARKGEAS